MKFGIITLYHKNYNYGGQLQARAMQMIFSDLGGEPAEVIAFESDRKEYLRNRIRELGLKGTTTNVLNKLRFRWMLKKHPDLKVQYQNRIQRFEQFIQQTVHTKCYLEKNLSDCSEYFDCFVCGSDQIWNPSWWTEPMFLTFTNKPKFAYAASIARDSLSTRQVDFMAQRVKDYLGISTRESSAAVLLANALKRNVICTLDPTFLISKQVWESLAESVDDSQPFVLIYNLGNSTDLLRGIASWAKKKEFRVVSIGFGHNTFFDSTFSPDYMVMDAGPAQWLGWIKKAEYVFTDSFHGTAFSILFEKNFWCFEKDIDKKNNENSRIYSILNALELNDRIIRTPMETGLLDKKIEYERVKNLLEEHQKSSIKYILDCMKEAEKCNEKKT